MTRWLLPYLLLFCCSWLWGCGSAGNNNSNFTTSSSGSSNSPSAEPVFRILGDMVSKTLGAAGGTVEAVAFDGTRFVLTVPAGALSQDTPLTMTPVAVSGELGLPIELPVAVKISPSGTQFTGGAELAITLPAGTDMSAYHAYVMEDSGTPMSLTLAKITGQTVTFKVFHLSVPGASPNPVPPTPADAILAAEFFEASVATIRGQVPHTLSEAQAESQMNSLADQYFTGLPAASTLRRDWGLSKQSLLKASVPRPSHRAALLKPPPQTAPRRPAARSPSVPAMWRSTTARGPSP